MLRHRCHRLTTAFIVVWSLLFSQLALAAYACPVESSVEAMAAMMEAGQACDGMDEQQPALCHEHATPLAKTFEAAKLPVLAPPALMQVLEWPVGLEDPGAQVLAPAAAVNAQPPPAPVFLSTLRLRV